MSPRRILKIAPFALAFAFASLSFAKAPSAQTVCNDRDHVISELAGSFSETPRAHGLTAAGIVVELLVSPQGTWTILATYATRQSCLLASGEAWEFFPPAGVAGAAAHVPAVPPQKRNL